MSNSQIKKDNSIYVLGFKSRFAELVFNHPWYTLLCIYFFTGCIVLYLERNIENLIWALIVVSPAFVGSVLLVRYFHRNTCYKVIIDTKREIATFYLMFNQGSVEVKTRSIKVVIDRHFNCIVDGRKFVLMNNLLHEVVALLPETTEIKFVGFFGRHWERELIRTGRKLR